MNGSLVEQSDSLLALLQDVPSLRLRGRVADVSGLAVDVVGLSNHVSVGDRVDLRARNGALVPAEIVAFRDGRAQAMTYLAADGLGPGAEVEARLHAAGNTLAVADSWIGASSIRWDGRSTGAGRCRVARRRCRRGVRRRRPRRGRGSGRGSISGSACSTRSPPAGPGSGWGCSPGRASASRCCWRCWRATAPATSPCWRWSASAGARCGNSSRTISARRGWRVRSSWSPPRTHRR